MLADRRLFDGDGVAIEGLALRWISRLDILDIRSKEDWPFRANRLVRESTLGS